MSTKSGGSRRPGIDPLFTSERGSILVQVMLMLVVLCGFCGLVVDYGVLSVARSQAQNAADAGALSGATALAFDAVLDTTRAQLSATQSAGGVKVWGESPVVTVGDDDFKVANECQIPGLPAPPDRIASCVTVRVFRNAANANALPTYLSQLFGVTTQGVRAQATAAVVPANAGRCLWPLAIPDTWQEKLAPADSFSKYQVNPGPPTPIPGGDNYIPPTSTDANGRNPVYHADTTGYALENETLSTNVALTMTGLMSGPVPATPANPWPLIDKSHFVPLSLPGATFAANLTTCNQNAFFIGETVAVDTAATWEQATTGAMTRKGNDTGASWDNVNLRILSSCAVNSTPCAVLSPRLVLLPVFDADEYDRSRGGADGTTPTIKIVNFIGFFIGNDTNGTTIQGNMSTYPGSVDPDRAFVRYEWAFMRSAVLMR